MVKSTFLRAQKKRKLATKYLYITTLLGFAVCIFSIRNAKRSIDDHYKYSNITSQSFQRLARFNAYKNKSNGFYALCIYNSIYYNYLKKQKKESDTVEVLKKFRKIIGLSLTGDFLYADEENDIFLKTYSSFYAQVLQFSSKLRHEVADSFNTILPDSLVLHLTNNTEEVYKTDYLLHFIPRNRNQIVEWVYIGEEFRPDKSDQVSESIGSIESEDLFRNNHSLIHENVLANNYFDMDSTGNELYNFLKDVYIKQAEKQTFEKAAIKETVFSSANIYGINFKFGLLLYLLAPLITYFYILEFFLSEKLNKLRGNNNKYSKPLLFNTKKIFRDSYSSSSLSNIYHILELLIRIIALGLLLFACILRYNLILFNENLFQKFMEMHFDFEVVLFDIISFLCFITAYSIADSRKPMSKILHSKFIVRILNSLFVFSITLPYIYMFLLFVTYPSYFKENISFYALLNLTVFIASFAWLYKNSIKNKKFPTFYLLMSMTIIIVILPSIIFILKE